MGDDLRHIPVLHTTVLDMLHPGPGETVLDCTLGLGGHAASFMEAIGPTGTFHGIDADEKNLATAKASLERFPCAKTFHHANFREVRELQLPPIDIAFADLGLSSPHIDEPDRGFSFRTDGPLDLRYDRSSGKSATEFLEDVSVDDLATIFHEYGEFHSYVKPLAGKIAGKKIETTTQLRTIVEEVFGYRSKSILPQVFQALRIAVNDELGSLDAILQTIPSLLKIGGRFGILSYHSLEDRAVKQAFRSCCKPTKDPLTGRVTHEAAYELLTTKAIKASDEESASNPRSRSVRFRVIKRIQ